MNLQMLQEEFSGQEKQQLMVRANRARVRGMADEERLTDTIPAFRVNDEVSRVVRGVVKADRRTISDVARALLERGVAAYQRDGLLFEPEAPTGEDEAHPGDTISVPTIDLKKKEPKLRKNRA